MSEEKLEEIKDSIEFQIKISKINGYDITCLLEEKDLLNEVYRLNKIINTKNKRIKRLEDNNKELKALLKEYKYELGLMELENTSIVSLD